ncbi:MAG: purN 2 [Candidatus Eremiobacteraeota bacterium]|nr:purN 2 [Candidatus Eremiobacteraeota bacterium]
MPPSEVKIAVWGSGPIYEAALRACLRNDVEIAEVHDCDVLLLANYTRILKAADRAIPRVGALCFHPSPLPKHRGRDAVYWTVKMNDPTCGVSWFWIDDGIDTGDVAGTVEVARPDVRPRELYEETLVPLGEMLLDTLLAQFKRGVFSRFPQDERLATYEPPRPKPAATLAAATES